ncbi:MAG: hypothetical protein ACO376_05765 [Gammaproteobacteria bacterium]
MFILSLKHRKLSLSLLADGLPVAQSIVTKELAALYTAVKAKNLTASQLGEIKEMVREALPVRSLLAHVACCRWLPIMCPRLACCLPFGRAQLVAGAKGNCTSLSFAQFAPSFRAASKRALSEAAIEGDDVPKGKKRKGKRSAGAGRSSGQGRGNRTMGKQGDGTSGTVARLGQSQPAADVLCEMQPRIERLSALLADWPAGVEDDGCPERAALRAACA